MGYTEQRGLTESLERRNPHTRSFQPFDAACVSAPPGRVKGALMRRLTPPPPVSLSLGMALSLIFLLFLTVLSGEAGNPRPTSMAASSPPSPVGPPRARDPITHISSPSPSSRLCAGDPRQQNHIHNGRACVIRRRAAGGLEWLGPFIPLRPGFGVRVWTQAVSGVPSILIHDLARPEPRLFGDREQKAT